MDPVILAFVIAVPSAFAVGVIFHKYVVSEAAAVKAHVTAEVGKLRGDLSLAISNLKKAV
jgi:hypothetical protein